MRFRDVALAVAWRNLHNFFLNPALVVPAVLFPMFFFTAFAGGLSSVQNTPGFDFPSGYTAFQFVFVLLQASAFGGVFTGFSIARDFESGFGRRLMLAAPNRFAIVAGYAIAALVRAVFDLGHPHGGRAARGDAGRRRRRRPRRALHARRDHELRLDHVVRRASRCGSARSRPAR